MINIALNSLVADSRVILENLLISTSSQSLLIIGDVGSGKTLLARALCGDFVDSDLIKLDGRSKCGEYELVFGQISTSSIQSRVGYMPQSAMAFFVAGTVAGEMLTSQFCSASSPEEADERLVTWCRESPISQKRQLAPLTLSGGQQRLFMLENVLATEPDHLVVDGGMVSLDEAFKIRATLLIRRWLAGDPRRTFICFGSDAEQAWFDFERTVALPRRGGNGLGEVWPKVVDRPEPTAEEVLSFRNVSAGPIISGRRLLRNISLSLNAGSYAGLRGPNGVGKTTLLRLVAGVRRPSRGEVYFRGTPLPRVSWRGLPHGIAYLPQEPELAGPMSVDPVGVNATRVGGHEFGFWREFFELDWSGDAETYWSMSSGERARATLMFQAAFNPSVWILDEPTFRIDAREMIRFLATLRDIRADTSAIIVSHDRAFLDAVVDREYLLTETSEVVTNLPPPRN